MEKQRIRKKRRRRFRKPDNVIVTLFSVTLALILVWAGLYWIDATNKAFMAKSPEGEELIQSLQEDIERSMHRTSDLQDEKESKPIADSGTKLDGGKTEDAVAEGTSMKSERKTEPMAEAAPTATEPSPSAAPQASAIPQKQPPSQKPVAEENPLVGTAAALAVYEQELNKLEDQCEAEIKKIESGAEASFRQLSRNDLAGIQAWDKSLRLDTANAESACDAEFQKLNQQAEKDNISAQTIEEWNQTYTAFKAKLREESEAKLVQLVGG